MYPYESVVLNILPGLCPNWTFQLSGCYIFCEAKGPLLVDLLYSIPSNSALNCSRRIDSSNEMTEGPFQVVVSSRAKYEGPASRVLSLQRAGRAELGRWVKTEISL